MSREILFRGKSVGDIDTWIIGYYHYDPTLLSHFICLKHSLFRYEVKAETVGQLTGIKEKSECDIFEGDIIRFHYFYQILGSNLGGQEAEHSLIGIIRWGQYGWAIEAIKGEHWEGYTGYGPGEGESTLCELCAMNESSIHEESFEVLGNIHSNPELLQP